LPGAPESIISGLEQNIKNVGPVTDILKDYTPEDLINLVLIGFEPKILEHTQVEYKCYCSRQRVSKAIASIGDEELVSMEQEGKPVEVTCQFCDKTYSFTPEEIRQMRLAAEEENKEDEQDV
jgi:molecular chaperone Hsp33